jgi:hypothetical protein
LLAISEALMILLTGPDAFPGPLLRTACLHFEDLG